jgi:hypothetical protein
MKTYVMTTGLLFGLVTLAHVWRVIEEVHLATDPGYILITLMTAGLCLWAWRLVSAAARLARETLPSINRS